MTDPERPHTAEEIAALPEGGGFGMSEEVIDGKTIRRPIAPNVIAFYSGPTDVVSYVDANGIGWRLGRYADGAWFRQRY